MKRVLPVSAIASLLAAAAAGAGSGLHVGEKFEAFQAKNRDGGDPCCQGCEPGKRPKPILVGDWDDPSRTRDLPVIEKLREKCSGDGKGLAVFGLAASIQDGKAAPWLTPNGITFPLVIARSAGEV